MDSEAPEFEFHPTKKLSSWDLFAMSAFWCGSNCIWGALLLIIIPKQVEELVGAIYRGPAVGFLQGSGAIVALTLPLFIGGMSDRCISRWGRRRPYIFWGSLVNLFGLFLMWQMGHRLSFAGYIIGFLVVQVGNNIATAAYSGIIPDIVPLKQRGIASGFMGFMSQLGILFGIGISGWSYDVNPSWTYIGIGFLFLAFTVITLLGTKEKPLTFKPPKIHWMTYIKSIWISPKEYPDFAWVWLTRFLVMLGFYAMQPYLLYFLQDIIHVTDPVRTAATLGGVILLASTLSGLFGGWISDYMGHKKVVYIANTIIAVMASTLIFTRTLEQVLLVGLIFGIGYGAYISVDWALGTNVLPTRTNAAKEMAVWHIAMTLPQTLGGPIAGLLLAAFGVVKVNGVVAYTLNGYAAVLLLSTIAFALGAIGLKNVKGST